VALTQPNPTQPNNVILAESKDLRLSLHSLRLSFCLSFRTLSVVERGRNPLLSCFSFPRQEETVISTEAVHGLIVNSAAEKSASTAAFP
jgi:hypothetical protein